LNANTDETPMKKMFVRTGAPLALLIGAAFPSHATHPVACDSLLGSFVEGAAIITTEQSPATITTASATMIEPCCRLRLRRHGICRACRPRALTQS